MRFWRRTHFFRHMKIISLAWIAGAVLAFTGMADAQNKTVAAYVTARFTGQRLSWIENLTWTDMAQTDRTTAVRLCRSRQNVPNRRRHRRRTDGCCRGNLLQVARGKRREVIRAYFDAQNGIGYTLARTQINSCDFSSSSYTYVAEGDKDLATFSIAPDLKYRVPFIKEVLAAARNDLKIFVSPWSPPAWMKSNNNMLHGGKLKPEFDDSWANYYCQIHPGLRKARHPHLGAGPCRTNRWRCNRGNRAITPVREERDFVKNHLGLRHSGTPGLKDKKLMVWDHNRSMMFQRALQRCWTIPKLRAKYRVGRRFIIGTSATTSRTSDLVRRSLSSG